MRTYLHSLIRPMTYAHLNCFVLATGPGLILFVLLVNLRAVPLASLPAFYVGSLLLFSWPVMRWFRVPPILSRCPSCGGVPPSGVLTPEGDGVRMDCPMCGHASLIPCRWVRARSGLVRQFDGPITAIVYGLDGRETGRRRARWPYFVVRWKDVSA